jgi:alpha-N-arabinofuranosidase
LKAANVRGRGTGRGRPWRPMKTRVARTRALATALAGLVILLATGEVAGQVPRATISIDATKVENSLSPLLYGQFAEFMFENIKGGMHAELIVNRGFEETPNVLGLSRYWERYPDNRNDDFAITFAWDQEEAYPSAQRAGSDRREHALRVRTTRGVVPRHGVFQSRIPIRPGLEYRGYIWMRAAKFDGRVTVSLEADVSDGEIYAEADIAGIGTEWRKYEFTLKPSKADPLARFAILLDGVGEIWIDQVSLLPGDAVGGVRADVLEKIKALRPAFVRWPGGNVAQDYRWTWGVGPRDERPVWANLSWRNEPEPSDFGTHEYIAFCREIGAEPTLVVNVEGRGATVEEAAAWVEYCNGPATSKHGALRAANGHPEPFNVKYWEIGNEIWGTWVRGHSDAATYGRNYNRYHAAMRAVDPTLKFIAVGDNNMRWNRTVLELAGTGIDYLAIHHYYGTGEMKGDPLNLMARPLYYERFYREVERLIREVAPGRDIKLAINEWNTSLPLPNEQGMEAALYGARLMNVFERTGDLVHMSAVSDLVNGWPGGIIQASRHGVYVTATYLVNQLYGTHTGARRLAVRSEGPTFDASIEGKNVPFLDAVASQTADGRRIFVKAVNTDQARSISVTVTVAGATVAPDGEIALVTGETLASANTFRDSDAVTIKRDRLVAGSRFTVEIPKHSVAVISLHVADEGEGPGQRDGRE